MKPSAFLECANLISVNAFNANTIIKEGETIGVNTDQWKALIYANTENTGIVNANTEIKSKIERLNDVQSKINAILDTKQNALYNVQKTTNELLDVAIKENDVNAEITIYDDNSKIAYQKGYDEKNFPFKILLGISGVSMIGLAILNIVQYKNNLKKFL